jgi:hypothetical protein
MNVLTWSRNKNFSHHGDLGEGKKKGLFREVTKCYLLIELPVMSNFKDAWKESTFFSLASAS